MTDGVEGGLRIGLWGFAEPDVEALRRLAAAAVPGTVCLAHQGGSPVCDGWLVASSAKTPRPAPRGLRPTPLCRIASPISTADGECAEPLKTELTVWLQKLRTPPSAAPSKASVLSPRECEVLELLSQGLSNDAIAVRLSIRVSTVKTYLRRVFARTGATNRTHAVAIYLAR